MKILLQLFTLLLLEGSFTIDDGDTDCLIQLFCLTSGWKKKKITLGYIDIERCIVNNICFGTEYGDYFHSAETCCLINAALKYVRQHLLGIL